MDLDKQKQNKRNTYTVQSGQKAIKGKTNYSTIHLKEFSLGKCIVLITTVTLKNSTYTVTLKSLVATSVKRKIHFLGALLKWSYLNEM